MKKDYQSKNKLGFTGGSVVNNPPAKGRDRSSILDLGRAHMPQSNYACVPQLLKPECLEPMLCNKRSHCSEKPKHHDWRVAPTHCN